MMKKIEKNHDFIFPKVKNDGRIIGRKTYGKVLIILRICNKGGTILDFSDVLIILSNSITKLLVSLYLYKLSGSPNVIIGMYFLSNSNLIFVNILLASFKDILPFTYEKSLCLFSNTVPFLYILLHLIWYLAFFTISIVLFNTITSFRLLLTL